MSLAPGAGEAAPAELPGPALPPRPPPGPALTAPPALPGAQQHQLRLRRQRSEVALGQLRAVLVEAEAAACQGKLPHGRVSGGRDRGSEQPQPQRLQLRTRPAGSSSPGPELRHPVVPVPSRTGRCTPHL